MDSDDEWKLTNQPTNHQPTIQTSQDSFDGETPKP